MVENMFEENYKTNNVGQFWDLFHFTTSYILYVFSNVFLLVLAPAEGSNPSGVPISNILSTP